MLSKSTARYIIKPMGWLHKGAAQTDMSGPADKSDDKCIW